MSSKKATKTKLPIEIHYVQKSLYKRADDQGMDAAYGYGMWDEDDRWGVKTAYGER